MNVKCIKYLREKSIVFIVLFSLSILSCADKKKDNEKKLYKTRLKKRHLFSNCHWPNGHSTKILEVEK